MKFRVLHTADWHLGQKLLVHDRQEEHQQALTWLLATMQEKKVDLLVVAGDIFDIGSPPNYARKQYYRFLAQLIKTPCRHVVIIGGNHDSPSMLEAPAEVLGHLHIHVLGGAREQLEEEILELHHPETGQLEAVVLAVPFLRDRDLRTHFQAESHEDRVGRIRQGILQHYQQLADICQARNYQVPVIASGHLFAYGAETQEKQDNIYLGDTQNIKHSDFSEQFDYIALGHIHRLQNVGKDHRAWYSGSLLPLSFSETKDQKGVLLIDFEQKKPAVEILPTPEWRRLKTITGSLSFIRKRLPQFDQEHQNDPFPPWVEVVVELTDWTPNVAEQIHTFTEDLRLEVIKIKIANTQITKQTTMDLASLPSLEELQPTDVFLRRCRQMNVPEEQQEDLLDQFISLQNWMEERADQ